MAEQTAQEKRNVSLQRYMDNAKRVIFERRGRLMQKFIFTDGRESLPMRIPFAEELALRLRGVTLASE